MGKCINHPDRETSYLCMKHDKYLCEACLKCGDPKIYCKFRPSCAIWFLNKRKNGLDADKKTDTGNHAEKLTGAARICVDPGSLSREDVIGA